MKRQAPAKVQIGKIFQDHSSCSRHSVVGIVVILGFLVYKISHPGAVPESVNPSHYLLPSLDVLDVLRQQGRHDPRHGGFPVSKARRESFLLRDMG